MRTDTIRPEYLFNIGEAVRGRIRIAGEDVLMKCGVILLIAVAAAIGQTGTASIQGTILQGTPLAASGAEIPLQVATGTKPAPITIRVTRRK